MTDSVTVAGIDVGGPAKGFHAVAIFGRNVVAKTASRSASEIALWCQNHGATVVAIDAPCRWRTDQARLAERELARDRISCFSTPTEAQAQRHPFFTWMIAGAELYAALADSFPLYDSGARRVFVAIETFPQAVACALAGEIVSAKRKNEVRRELLRLSGISPSGLANIDEIDAALCALAADRFARNEFKSYGDAESGLIIVPKTPVTGFVGQNYLPRPATPTAAKPTDAAPGATRPTSGPQNFQIFGSEPTWASYIGLFLINFGHVEFLVSAYLETQLTPKDFEAIRGRPFHERLERAGTLFSALPEKRAAFEELMPSLEAARVFRNHLAHGYLNASLTSNGTGIEMHIIQAKDMSNELCPETRRLGFVELEQQVVAIGKLTEAFSDLTGTTPSLGTIQLE